MNNFVHVPCDCNNCIHRDAVLKRIKEQIALYKKHNDIGNKPYNVVTANDYRILDELVKILNGPPEDSYRTDEDRGLGVFY